MEEETRTLFRGMILTVPNNLKFTKLQYSINESMKRIIGEKHKITEIYENGNFRMREFSWDKRNFQSKKPRKKIPIAHFDPEELVT